MKIGENRDENLIKNAKCCEFYRKCLQNLRNFEEHLLKFCDGAVQRNSNLIDLVKSFPTKFWLKKSVSIQPRTSPSKFGSQITVPITYRASCNAHCFKLLSNEINLCENFGIEKCTCSGTHNYALVKRKVEDPAWDARSACSMPILGLALCSTFAIHFREFFAATAIQLLRSNPSVAQLIWELRCYFTSSHLFRNTSQFLFQKRCLHLL